MSWLDGKVGRSAAGPGATVGGALDPRAQAAGARLAEALRATEPQCVMLVGPGHTGKTQTAMAARDALDPGHEASVHTSAAILNNHARQVPSDRSARWQSWAEGRATLRKPPGNAAFFRGDQWKG